MQLQVPIVRVPPVHRLIPNNCVCNKRRLVIGPRRGDEDPLAHLGSAASVRWQQVRRENGRDVRNSVSLGPQSLDNDFPFVLMTRASQVPHILQKDECRAPGLDDPQDVPVERSAGLLHSLLGAGLAERLAGEAGKENVVFRDGHAVVISVCRDITQRVYAPVPLVDAGCNWSISTA